MRVVVDTNVYVSALVFGGKPREVVRLSESGAILITGDLDLLDLRPLAGMLICTPAEFLQLAAPDGARSS